MTLTSSNIAPLIDDDCPGGMSVPDSHLFLDEEDAQAKADEMGLEDVHQMSIDGATFWVPGQTHQAYLMARADLAAGFVDDLDVYQD